jgi:hypothetical protein
VVGWWNAQMERSTSLVGTPPYRKRPPAMGRGTPGRTLPPRAQAVQGESRAGRPGTEGGSEQQLQRHVEMFRDFEKVNSDVVDVQATLDKPQQRQATTPTLYSTNTLRAATAKCVPACSARALAYVGVLGTPPPPRG